MRKIVITSVLAASLSLIVSHADAQGMGGGSGMEGGHGGGHRRGGSGHGRPGGPGGGPPVNLPAPASVSAAMRLNGVVTVAGQVRSLSHVTLASAKADQSALYAERSAQVMLDAVTLNSDIGVSMIEDSRDTGIGAALLLLSQSRAQINGGVIATTGIGVNAVYLSDAGTQGTLKSTAISTRASEAYGIQVTGGASLTAENLQVMTQSDHAPALTVDQGSLATLTGGIYTTNGPLSPAVRAGGDVTAVALTATANHGDAIAVEGARSIGLKGAVLTASGAAIAISAPDAAPSNAGPAKVGPANIELNSGTLRTRREAVSISNASAVITLDQVDIESMSGTLVRAAAGASGPLGRNGGDIRIEAHRQVLNGDMVTDVISSIVLDLRDGSRFTGRTTFNVNVTVDSTSTWTLSDDTHVGKLEAIVAGDTVANVIGNGHNLTYDAKFNPALGGRTYTLTGGGALVAGMGL